MISRGYRSTSGKRLAGTALVLTCGALPGCGGSDQPSERPFEPRERIIREVEWSEEFAIKGSLQDTLLLGPGRLAADARGVSVLDHLRQQVIRFRPDGTRAWTFGGRGQGPDEFLRALHIQMDGRGRTWVLDIGNGRITVLDSGGRAAMRIPLGEVGAGLAGVVSIDSGRAIVGIVGLGHPFLLIDESGDVVERFRLPGREFRDLQSIADQFEMAADPTSRRWVAAFSLRDRFVAFDGTTPMAYRGWFVEEIAPPELVIEASPTGGRSVTLGRHTTAVVAHTLSPQRLYVLFGGHGRDRGRLVDTYDLDTGEYIESLRVPGGAYQISYGGGMLYLAYADPYPSLIGLRPTEGRLP